MDHRALVWVLKYSDARADFLVIDSSIDGSSLLQREVRRDFYRVADGFLPIKLHTEDLFRSQVVPQPQLSVGRIRT